MSGQVIIAGFSSTDKVPGPYGENKWGTGAQSAASIPLLLLLVGLPGSTGGTADVDTEIVDVLDPETGDDAFEDGSELALMCRDALEIDGVAIKAIAVAPNGTATAAEATITFTGTATTLGTFECTLAGKTINVTTPVGTTAAQAAALAADAINATPHLPYRATVAGAVVTLTVISEGVRGNQHIIRQNAKTASAGLTSALAGGTPLASGGVPFAGGSGVESYTNVLATLRASGFDRIALACNDATSLAAWETQLDAQATAIEGLLQEAVFATNGSASAHQSLTSVTANNPLIQGVHCLNSETHPSRLAAQFMAIRTQREQADPAASHDDVVLPSAAPQQRKDWPTHAQLVAALNNGSTPCKTGPDGKVRIVRSITTKCLNGTTPDYSTLDTGEVSCPHFVLKSLKLYWTTVLLPGNPRTADDPADGEKQRPSGVLTPSLTAAEFEGELRKFEAGDIGGTTVPPLIINVDRNKPVATYDGIADRVMVAVTVEVAPANHQIGISVRQK